MRMMHCNLSITLCVVALVLSIKADPITSYAALGDSYAAGDGAGSSKLLPGSDPVCGRFTDAYPIWISNNSALSISPYEFRNAACGRATTHSIIKDQVPRIADSQIVTLTVGGNEVDFFLVLNECIQQWHPLGSCHNQLVASKKAIESSKFIADYNLMIREAVSKLAPGARLFVTGYATFFNEFTEQCNFVTFSKTRPDNYLTNELRAKFNSLVQLLNGVIQAAAEAHGAEYVDIDSIFEGHRFCEEGVDEPVQREATWFFTLKYDQSDMTLKGAGSQTAMGNPFEDFYDLTRVFHPTGLGHKAIHQAIVKKILGEAA